MATEVDAVLQKEQEQEQEEEEGSSGCRGQGGARGFECHQANEDACAHGLHKKNRISVAKVRVNSPKFSHKTAGVCVCWRRRRLIRLTGFLNRCAVLLGLTQGVC